MSIRLWIASLALAAGLVAPAWAEDAFPVTIDHAFGQTTIPAKPQRVLTISWMSQDTVIALGIVPVAIPLQTWGGDADGYLPWVHEALDALGKGYPQQIEYGETLPFEQILAADPDVILARYSGLTENDYKRLSEIAPVVAYKQEPWTGEWRDVTRTIGKALGESEKAETLITDTEAYIAARAKEHPEFSGKSFVFATAGNGGNALGVYVSIDPRVQLIEDLGFTLAPGAAVLPTNAGWYQDVSVENLGTLDADLLIGWFSDEETVQYLKSNELFSRYRPIAEDHLVPLLGQSDVMAVSAPSPLSVPWVLDRLVPQLADAVAR